MTMPKPLSTATRAARKARKIEELILRGPIGPSQVRTKAHRVYVGVDEIAGSEPYLVKWTENGMPQAQRLEDEGAANLLILVLKKRNLKYELWVLAGQLEAK